MNGIYNFWVKNSFLITIGIIAVMLLSPGTPEWALINKIILLEVLTLFLCQLAVYIHYKSPVTFFINTGSDSLLNSTEQHSLIQANSRIYQSVHIFVGLVVLAVYFLEKGGI